MKQHVIFEKTEKRGLEKNWYQIKFSEKKEVFILKDGKTSIEVLYTTSQRIVALNLSGYVYADQIIIREVNGKPLLECYSHGKFIQWVDQEMCWS